MVERLFIHKFGLDKICRLNYNSRKRCSMFRKFEQLCEAYSQENQSTSKAFFGFISRVEKKLKDRSLSEAVKDRDFIYSSFETANGRTKISRSQYFFIKKSWMYLCSYFGLEQPQIPSYREICTSAKESKGFGYFKDFQDLLLFIDRVGGMKIPEYSKNCGYAQVKAIVCLGWAGITQSEVSTAKISDLIENSGKLYLNTKSGLHNIPEDVRSTLEKIIKLPFLQNRKGLIVPISVGTNFVVPRASSTSEYTEDLKIGSVLQGFNIDADAAFRRKISYRQLRMNALFVQTYEDKRDIPIREKLAFYAYKEEQQVYPSDSLFVDYNAWLDVFYPNEERD